MAMSCVKCLVASANVANHGRDARMMLAMQYARLCGMLVAQGLIAVIATISLFQEVHKWNRSNLPVISYLNVPVDELRRRDPKKFIAGRCIDPRRWLGLAY